LSVVRTYGGLGVALVRELSERGLQTFRVAEARGIATTLGIAQSYLPVLLHSLAGAGLVRRLKHGTYALAGITEGPRTHPFAVGEALVEPSAVSGWSALNHHGLTEQIPRTVTLTTPKKVVTPSMRGKAREGDATWTVGEDRFEFVTVVPHHFFGLEEVWMGDSKVKVLDRERALLDCFALPRRFGGLSEGLGILEAHMHELDLERLVKHALAYGKASVAKRLGWALEKAGASRKVLRPLRDLPINGYRPLDPTRPARGPMNSAWHVRENLASETTQ